MGHFKRKSQTEGGVAHQPLLVSEIYSDCPFVWYQNIRSVLFDFVTKHACDGQSDGRTDRQTDKITTRKTALGIATLRGKNCQLFNSIALIRRQQ